MTIYAPLADKDLRTATLLRRIDKAFPWHRALLSLLLAPGFIQAATPIDGWYTSGFGGYIYLPGNINKTIQSLQRNDVSYRSGFEAGGSIGFKSNPMRYEGEATYLRATPNKFHINGVKQTGVGGYTQAILGLVNIYYDFPYTLAPALQPYLGVGFGYGWIQSVLNQTGPTLNTHFVAQSSAFAYQGTAGIMFNFAENYSLNAGYRFVGTNNLFAFGKIFQVHMATVGVTYRFDGNNYK